MALHNALTGAELHEPKGAAAAVAGHTFIADGAGSGAFKAPVGDNVVIINAEADFPAQDSTTITLAASTQYFIAKPFTTAKRFIVSEGSTINSINQFVVMVTYTGTGNMFTSAGVNWTIRIVKSLRDRIFNKAVFTPVSVNLITT